VSAISTPQSKCTRHVYQQFQPLSLCPCSRDLTIKNQQQTMNSKLETQCLTHSFLCKICQLERIPGDLRRTVLAQKNIQITAPNRTFCIIFPNVLSLSLLTPLLKALPTAVFITAVLAFIKSCDGNAKALLIGAATCNQAHKQTLTICVTNNRFCYSYLGGETEQLQMRFDVRTSHLFEIHNGEV
jgi:hypothetical protein